MVSLETCILAPLDGQLIFQKWGLICEIIGRELIIRKKSSFLCHAFFTRKKNATVMKQLRKFVFFNSFVSASSHFCLWRNVKKKSLRVSVTVPFTELLSIACLYALSWAETLLLTQREQKKIVYRKH